MPNYRGIDYGMGLSNVDRETGIRYGVISQHSINLDCFDPEYDYGKPHCPECGNEIKASDDKTLWDGIEDADIDGSGTPTNEDKYGWWNGKDFTCLDCKRCFWSDSVYSDEPLGWTIDDGEYKLCDCLDTDIFVLKSPYFTYAQYCSPCVPGACNLDSPLELETVADVNLVHKSAELNGYSRCYCLAPDWFDSDSRMPYRCFRVSDGVEVFGLCPHGIDVNQLCGECSKRDIRR